MFATGSALGGLVFGAVRLRAPLTRQLLGATAAVAVLLWPLLLADTVPPSRCSTCRPGWPSPPP
ncbi:hypothetical protein ACYAFX_20545 [Rhodococcus aetherivorans]